MTNDQLIQIENLKALSLRIEKSWKERQYRNIGRYKNFDINRLSDSKKEQFESHIKLEAEKELLRNGEKKIVFPNEWKIRFFITAEWIVADWAIRNHLNHIDFNEESLFSKVDCNIDGVNIDVKTTVGLGRRKAIPFHSKQRDYHEIQVAVMSKVYSPKTHYKKASTQHGIQGIFDSSQYIQINTPLNYFKIESPYKNPCYFQPLENYFNTNQIILQNTQFDTKVLNHWLKNEVTPSLDINSFNYNLSAYLFILRSSPVRLHETLRMLLPEIHHDFIPIVIELANEKKITLLPHFLADYLVAKINGNSKIDTNNFINIVFSIYYPNDFQREFLISLLKLADVLPEVRCRWHPEETIDQMGIEFDGDGYIPIFYAKCCQNPQMKTTIYGYSWKTLEKVIYKINPSCNDSNCGGLTHQWFDYSEYSNKNKTFCKDSCIIHGRKAHDKIAEEEKRIYYSGNNDDSYSPENSAEDIPF